MHFFTVATYFQKIEEEKSRTAMTILLAELFQQASADEIAAICYLSLGSLYAPYQGTQFNMAEKSLIKVVAQLLKQDVTEIAAQVKKTGDLGLVIEKNDEKNSFSAGEAKTVMDVYNSLVALQSLQGVGSQEGKQKHLLALMTTINRVSAKYIIRVILGTIRLGFSDMTIIDALSWMLSGNKIHKERIEAAYNICTDIGLIAKKIKESGIDALNHISIIPGIPIRPASAERLPSAHDIMEKIGSCIAQPKLDGFRLQVHLVRPEGASEPLVFFYSRNLQNMSSMFPDLCQAVAHLSLQSLIFEGEAIAFDEQTQTFLPFQQTVKRKRKHQIEKAMTDLPLRLFIFDLLYVDGTSCLSYPQNQRRQMLEKIIGPSLEDTLAIIEEKPVRTEQELADYFIETVGAGLEGLVVKRPDAPYQAGKRNFNWIKLKRHESGHLEDTIDVVILGYYAGAGKRASFGIGSFLVGVYNATQDRFETVAKVGTGLKDEDWRELKKRCDRLLSDKQFKNVVCAKELVPDVWIYPEIVCVIRADEITLSPLHTAGKSDNQPGYALRFPRFVQYREDKSATQVTTIGEIISLYNAQGK